MRCAYGYDAVANTKEEDPTGLLLEGFRYRDLETGCFITRDPIGNNLMMPKEKWMVDGREVSYQEYEEALEPGVPQAGNGPTKTAKDSGAEADAHIAGSEEGAIPGQKSHMHTAAAGFPNLYTYVNENPWTFFDPEGLDALIFTPTGHSNPVSNTDFKQTDTRGQVTNGRLDWVDNKGNVTGSWSANSGGYGGGKSPLKGDDRRAQPGEYKVDNYRPNRGGLFASDGVGYTFDLTSKDGHDPRGDLRIHPDGGEAGTHGCLGLREPAAKLKEFEKRMSDYLKTHKSMPASLKPSAPPPPPPKKKSDQ